MASNTQSVLQLMNRLVKLAILVAGIYVVLRCVDSCDQASDDIEIQDTPVVINSIRPIGELYAYTAITEDFAVTTEEDVGFFFKRNYKFVQTLRMKVSYVLDLDRVEYIEREGTDTVVVRLPRLRYIQSEQGGHLLGEAEIASFDASSAIRMVEQKIRSRYDSPDNYGKAMAHAREVLAAFITQCGRVPVFEEQ